MNHLHSERLVHFSNVNSLMKLSLGLIFFTIISTSLVYAESIPVDTDVTSFDIPYTTMGMTITEIESDTESMSLIFSVDVTDLNGKLNIILDRSFFDSIYDDVNYDFIILADGDYALFEETEINSQSRTLSITVPSGTEDLEIIGSILDDSLPIILVDFNKNKAAADKAAADKAAADKAAQTQCGSGTILEGDTCILDQRCGPGTILEDGACILDSIPMKSSSSVNSKELITSVTIASGIAGIIGIILALISRTKRNKN